MLQNMQALIDEWIVGMQAVDNILRNVYFK